jgi:hypothetical protein
MPENEFTMRWAFTLNILASAFCIGGVAELTVQSYPIVARDDFLGIMATMLAQQHRGLFPDVLAAATLASKVKSGDKRPGKGGMEGAGGGTEDL